MTEYQKPALDSFLFHLLGPSAETVAGRLDELANSKPVISEIGEAAAELESLSLPKAVSESASEIEFADTSEDAETPSMQRGIPVLVMLRDGRQRELDVAGFVQGSQLGNVLTGSASAAAIAALADYQDVLQVDVSRDAGADELDVSIAATKGRDVHVPPIDERGAGAIVAVIDSGFDVLHKAFLDDQGQTRILALWDQTQDPPPNAQNQPAYGTLHRREDIARYLRTNVPAGLGRDPKGHGTHVASIAAGRAAGSFKGGMAPEADLILVISKIATPAGDPLSIGYSRAHIDALEFIDRLAASENKPVAVNISQGMNAGAHDGTSLLEAAFDNFSASGRLPGRVLVKSAGNFGEKNLHSRFQIGDAQVIDLTWMSWSAPRPRDVLEFWFPSCDDISFELFAPKSGGKTDAVSFDPAKTRTQGQFASGNFYAMTLDRYHRDNGDARLLISVEPGTAQGIALGNWVLRAKATSIRSEGIVDGWIERPFGTTIEFSTHSTVDGSLTIPGTANSVITVAALDRAQHGSVMGFSSRGATRDGRNRPDVGAPGDGIVAAEAGTRDGATVKDGSSMAAPHVTGAIALLMANRARKGKPQANSNQIRAVLNQSARGFNGRWNSARGWGMLDVEAFLTQF